MAQKTITRADLSTAIHKELGLALTESNEMVDRVLDEITKALSKGETVKIASFGTFSVRKKRQRIGRNPKTGVEVPITARATLSFSVSNLLKKKINQTQSRKKSA